MNVKKELGDLVGYLWVAFGLALIAGTFVGTMYLAVRAFIWLAP